MTILIVDDELVSRKTLEKLLSSIDECDSAENGEDALKIVSERRPDLILLDISMTGIDGYEVCRRLKAEPQTEPIPIIFLSAHTKVEEKTRAFGLGGGRLHHKLLIGGAAASLYIDTPGGGICSSHRVQKELRKGIWAAFPQGT